MPRPPEHDRKREDKAQYHERAARLYRNPQLNNALDELMDNSAAREEARRDPAAYLRLKGVNLTEDTKVSFKQMSLEVCVEFCWCWWGSCCCFGWCDWYRWYDYCW